VHRVLHRAAAHDRTHARLLRWRTGCRACLDESFVALRRAGELPPQAARTAALSSRVQRAARGLRGGGGPGAACRKRAKQRERTRGARGARRARHARHGAGARHGLYRLSYESG
jgi:hypothetical protein